MSDVEKYGLWAVIGFAAILVLIGLGGGDEEEPLRRAVARPTVVEAPPSGAAVVQPAAQARTARVPTVRREGGADASPAHVFTVQPVVSAAASFRWDEGPVAYPGPRTAVSQAGRSSDAAALEHVVKKGETLGDISNRYFGTSTRWRELLVLNPGLDEKKLKVGQVLVVKGAATAASAAPATPVTPAAVKSSPATRTYVVQTGDTLGAIAARLLGSSRRSTELYEANRHVLASPDRLKAGQVLTIP